MMVDNLFGAALQRESDVSYNILHGFENYLSQCAPILGATNDRKGRNKMIDRLRIKNFKILYDLELPRLTRFNLFGGKNNAGKSSVLEAIALFYNRLNPAILLNLQGARGMLEMPIEPQTVWAPYFSRYELDRPITIETKSGDEHLNMKLAFVASYSPTVASRPGTVGIPMIRSDQRSSNVYALNVELTNDKISPQSLHFTMSNSGLGIHIHRIEGNVPACGFLYARNQPNPRDDANFFGQLATINAEDKILKFVKIVEPNLIGLTTIAFGNNSVLHGDIGIGRKIPIYHMGDGVVRAVHLVLFIAACRGGVVLIDELGNGIHYSILSSVIEAVAAAAKEFDVQIFATTHSAELIREAHGGMAEEHAKELTYIRLDRSKDVVVAKTYDHETLAAAIENEWEVR